MITAPADLTEIDVNDLEDGELREAFMAHFRALEAFHEKMRPHQEAIEQIIERVGRGDLVGHCRDCQRPLFLRDPKHFYTARREFACKPACGAPSARADKAASHA